MGCGRDSKRVRVTACGVPCHAASSFGWHVPHTALPTQSRVDASVWPASSTVTTSTNTFVTDRKLPCLAAPWYLDSVTAHVIGLTGGIASGKSTVARLLVERGATVIDAD